MEYKTDLTDYFDKIDFNLSWQILKFSPDNQDLAIVINGERVDVAFKSEVRPLQAHALASGTLSGQQLLIVSPYITPNAKEFLRSERINYIDSYGNAFIDLPHTKVYVEKGNGKPVTKEYPSLFTPTGGRVLFHLLADRNAVDYNYRELAYASGVSLGSVSKVINALLDEGFAIKKNQKEIELVRKEELLERWVLLLNEKLLPASIHGRYAFSRLSNSESWRDIYLGEDTIWGGEAAASILTDYLNPEEFSLFSTASKGELIQRLRIVPDPNGAITLYRPFWTATEHFGNRYKRIAHPLIIYAQLMYSGFSRNIETAHLIYHQFLKHEL